MMVRFIANVSGDVVSLLWFWVVGLTARTPRSTQPFFKRSLNREGVC